MIVIADTTPLHYLILIGQADLLRALYGSVTLPNSVQSELLHAQAPPVVREWMQQPPAWIKIVEPVSTTDQILLKLDRGERDAIALAVQMQAELILMDE